MFVLSKSNYSGQVRKCDVCKVFYVEGFRAFLHFQINRTTTDYAFISVTYKVKLDVSRLKQFFSWRQPWQLMLTVGLHVTYKKIVDCVKTLVCQTTLSLLVQEAIKKKSFIVSLMTIISLQTIKDIKNKRDFTRFYEFFREPKVQPAPVSWNHVVQHEDTESL